MFNTKIFFLISLLIISLLSHGGNVIFVENCCGVFVVHDNITFAEAKNKAIYLAKIEALNRAGVHSKVSSTSLLISSQLSQVNFNQSFFEIATEEMQGIVANYYVSNERRFIENGLTKIEVCINAEVILFTESSDPFFTIEVQGIKELYYENEKLKFSVKPNADGFLYIYLFENESVQLLYPNSVNFFEPSDLLFKKGVTYSFPTKPGFEYNLVSPSKEVFHQLVFVYSKVEIPLIAKPTAEKVRIQIYSLPRDKVQIQSFVYKLKQKL